MQGAPDDDDDDDALKKMYAKVEHVIRAKALTQAEIDRRRFRVTTNLDLIMFDAEETNACKKLRKLQNDRLKRAYKRNTCLRKATVLRDMDGNRHTWHKASTNGKRAHFAWSDEHKTEDNQRSPAESQAHMRGKEWAMRLIMQNLLKVATVCGSEYHVAAASLPGGGSVPAWVSEREVRKCVDAFELNGSGDGVTVEREWRWTMPDGKYLVLDVAILHDGKLHAAVEIEYKHANSPEKRAAFKKHGVLNAQIDSREVYSKCRTRNWATATRHVLVHHNPSSTTLAWQCDACVRREEAAKQEQERKEAEFQQRKRKREEEEAPHLTTFAQRAPEKWLKGFLHLMHPSEMPVAIKGDPNHMCVELTSSNPQTRINSNVARLQLRVTNAIYARCRAIKGGRMVCARISALRGAVGMRDITWIVAGAELPMDYIRENQAAQRRRTQEFVDAFQREVPDDVLNAAMDEFERDA